MDSIFHPTNPRKPAVPAPTSASNAFVHFLYENNIPFNVLSSGSFKSFWKTWQKGENPLTRQNAAGPSLVREFKGAQAVIGAQMECIEWVALTTDGWSGKRVSLWSVTASGIDKDWQRILIKLGCIPVVATIHSSDVLAAKIKQLLSDFDCRPEKVVSVTTDEGGAAPKIAEHFDAFEVHCGVHLLNTSQKNAIETLNQQVPIAGLYFGIVQDMSKTFRHPKAAHQLIANQIATNEPIAAIQRRVVTRFNTWIAPLRSVKAAKDSIHRYVMATDEVGFADVYLQHKEHFWRFVDAMIDLFTPYEKATLSLSSSEATLDVLVSSYFILLQELDSLHSTWSAISETTVDPIRDIVLACIALFRTNLAEKFEPLTDPELIAFVLNPFHKEMPGKHKWNQFVRMGHQKLTALWNTIKQSPADSSETMSGVIEGSSLYGDGWQLPSSVTDAESANDELYTFFRVIPTSVKALHFWKRNAPFFPTLAPIARKYLSPKPSQIDSERDFSAIRLILTDLRSNLTTDKVHKLSVIRPLLREHYQTQPVTRSEASQAADARRVASTAQTRLQRLSAEYADILPNPAPADVGRRGVSGAAEPGARAIDIDPTDAMDIGDGERDSDDDFELEDELEEFRATEAPRVVPHMPAAPSRSSRRGGPTCTLYPVGRGVLQYIARFKNLDRDPPPYERIFGAKASLISSFTLVAGLNSTHWVVSITDEAKSRYGSSKTLMRELGEVTSITPEMYPTAAPSALQ